MAKGQTATEMANAPLVRPELTDTPAAVTYGLPFTLLGFKLNPKPKDYPNDDGSTVRKVATASVRIGESGITFNAAIYISTSIVKVADGTKEQRKIVCNLPSTGRGFPTAVFQAEDPATTTAMINWRNETAREFVKWNATLSKGGAAERHTVSAEVGIAFE